MTNVFVCPGNITIYKEKTRDRPRVSWIPPPIGYVKFNVDGASSGKPGLAGIGGVMRSHASEELARFSKFVGIEDSNVAELMAIREAFLTFIDSPYRKLRKWEVVHIFKEANQVADQLAKEGVSRTSDLVVTLWD
ncbi:hypothetical protein PTKIN_Ptkin17bG0056800 [Pterospermum kingtungense]